MRTGLCSMILLLASAGLAAAENGPAGETVTVKLKKTALPLSSFTQASAASHIRSSAPGNVPAGYDTLFVGRLGAERTPDGLEMGGVEVRFLHRGYDRASFEIFHCPKDGEPVRLERLQGAVHAVYVAFGPLIIEGLPPLTVHFYYPTSKVEEWKQRPGRALFVIPMECLSGEAVINGRKTAVGLYDRNLNLKYDDFCTLHTHDGDWLLVDGNGDGKFLVNAPGPDVMGFTRVVSLGGSFWKPSLKADELTLTPAAVDMFSVRLIGLGMPCKITGWSVLTGAVACDLDELSCAKFPKAAFRLYSYVWTRDNWQVIGSLGVTGQRNPPDGGIMELEAGPVLRGEVKKKSGEGSAAIYTFRCLGRAGETVTVMNMQKRVDPVFVIKDASGTEVFRKSIPFG